ncbi:MAG: PEP-CTERM sorting domain-containing protein [Planctomycetia bacterium]|nr:PEP-CTERM sorting domain-containing protein [Planctomycetia bacterium]
MRSFFAKTCRTQIAVAAVGLAAVSSVASAGQLTTWRGAGTNGNWTTANSWSTTPNASSTWSLVYGGNPTYTSGTVGTAAPLLSGSTVSVDSINYTNTGVAGQTASFTIRTASGRTLSLLDGATITTAAASSALTEVFNGAVQLSGTTNFDLGANHGVNFIPSSAVGSSSFNKTGAGTLNVGVAIPLTGLKIDAGMVRFNGNVAAGNVSGQTVDVGSGGATGTLNFNVLTAPVSSDVNVRMNGNGTVSVDGAGSSVTFTNSQFNVANGSLGPAVLGLAGSAGATQTVSGAIVDNGGATSLAITGNNLWVLNGASTFSGSATVGANAKLLLDGSLATTSLTSVTGFLGGNGAINGGVRVSGNGTIAPGGSASSGAVVTPSIGELDVGSLLLSGTGVKSVFTVAGTTPGTEFDRINGGPGGSMTFAGTLDLTLTGTQTYANNTTFNLFNFGSYTAGLGKISFNGAGTPYAGLAFSQTGTAGIWMTGYTAAPLGEALLFNENTGDLVVVPEPSSIVIAGLGVAVAGWHVVRRRRQPKSSEV